MRDNNINSFIGLLLEICKIEHVKHVEGMLFRCSFGYMLRGSVVSGYEYDVLI